MTDARTDGAAARRIQEDEERSIGAAMRATLWFVVIVLLFAWAGVADACLPRAANAVAAAARTG